MALSEEQIVLYSRQILLAEVGGKGQERLGAAVVEVRGGGVAELSAATYLVAGGTPVGPGDGELVLGWREGRGLAAFRRSDGCADCFALNARGLSPAAPGVAGVLLGTLGALAYQRAVLGWTDSVGAVELDAEGAIRAAPIARCARHA
jgi:hypothetical protein